MKQKQMTAVAVGCGLACAVCVGAFMASVQGQADSARTEALARYGGEQIEVCVATRDIAAGERVDLSAVETKLWVADLLPEGAVRSNGDAVGKVATSSILKGEVISEKRFESERDALDVPAGKEAVSVPAKAVQAVGGAVRPGMSVDVYSSGNTTTVAIAHDVLVLDSSVGDSGKLVSSDSGWITLAINPENVQEVIAAAEKTSLYFVIPGAEIEGITQVEGAAPTESAAAESAPAESVSTESAAAESTGQPESSAGNPSGQAEGTASAAASEQAGGGDR